MGDLNVALASAFYNYDMRGFLNCFVHSMADCQREGGVVPSMLPTPKWENENCIVWNSAFVFAVEKLHDYYGDAGFLREIYPDLRRFAQIDMEALAEGEWIWPKWDFADWVSPIGDEYGKIDALSSEGHTLCSTAYAYAMLRAMEKLARILHENDDARIYENAAEKVREAFDRKFYNADKQIYETGEWRPSGKRTEYRQTSNLLPLSFGMVSGDKRKAVAENLAKDFIAKDYHLDTGCVGTRAVLPVLFDEGYAEIAYRVLTQDTYPGWGHWIAKNGPSTGAWECWEPATRSRNHYFLGTYEEALYSHILGIRNVRDGFTHCTIAPEIECGLEFAEGSIQTVNGTVSCAWKKVDGKTIVETEVPDGTVAEVILPGIREQISGCKKEYIV